MSINSGLAPLTLPGAPALPVARQRRGPDLRLAGTVLMTVILAEAALLFFPQALLLHPMQAGVPFKQLSGYTMLALMVAAMAFGFLRRAPSLATRQALLNDLHQFGGLLLLLLLSLHAASRPSGFLLLLFHGLACALAAGALRALFGRRLGRAGSTTLLAVHISLSCLVSAAALLHLYFVYAYTA